MTPTEKLIKIRKCADCAVKLDPGVWYSGFTAAKKYATSMDLPFVAVWSNGENCSHCVNFEQVIIGKTSASLLAKTDYVLYVGLVNDKTADDKYLGRGFKFTNKNGTNNKYPMVRCYWKLGKVDTVLDGDTLRNRKTGSAGAKAIASKLKSIFGK